METILNKLREQAEKNDGHMKTVRLKVQFQKPSLDWDPILKERGRFWIGVKVRGITSHHAEELTEEIDKAGIRAIAFN